jgi:hypothetical protein
MTHTLARLFPATVTPSSTPVRFKASFTAAAAAASAAEPIGPAAVHSSKEGALLISVLRVIAKELATSNTCMIKLTNFFLASGSGAADVKKSLEFLLNGKAQAVEKGQSLALAKVIARSTSH